MHVHALGNSAAAEDVVEVLQQDGCVIVGNLVPASLMDAIYAELKPFIEATKIGRDDFAGFRMQRTGSCVGWVADPPFLERLTSILKNYSQGHSPTS